MNYPLISSGQVQAAAGLAEAVADRYGCVGVISRAAVGTAALLDQAAQELSSRRIRCVRVHGPAAGGLASRDLIAQIVARPDPGALTDADLKAGFRTLTEPGEGFRRVALLVSEAHSLLPSALRYVQLAHQASPAKLCIVLAGKPDLATALEGEDFIPLRSAMHMMELSEPAGAGLFDKASALPEPLAPRASGSSPLVRLGLAAAIIPIVGLIWWRHLPEVPAATVPPPDAPSVRASVNPPSVPAGVSAPNAPAGVNMQGVPASMDAPSVPPAANPPAAPLPAAVSTERAEEPPPLDPEGGAGLPAADPAPLAATAPASEPPATEAPPAPEAPAEQSAAVAEQPPAAAEPPAAAGPPAPEPSAAVAEPAVPAADPPAVAAELPAVPPERSEAPPQEAGVAASPPPPAAPTPDAGPPAPEPAIAAKPPQPHGTLTVTTAPPAQGGARRAAPPAAVPQAAAPPVRTAEDRPSPADEKRCREIVFRAQLGKDPSDADKQFLRNGCRGG